MHNLITEMLNFSIIQIIDNDCQFSCMLKVISITIISSIRYNYLNFGHITFIDGVLGFSWTKNHLL